MGYQHDQERSCLLFKDLSIGVDLGQVETQEELDKIKYIGLEHYETQIVRYFRRLLQPQCDHSEHVPGFLVDPFGVFLRLVAKLKTLLKCVVEKLEFSLECVEDR